MNRPVGSRPVGSTRSESIVVVDVDRSTQARQRLGEERADFILRQLQLVFRSVAARFEADHFAGTGDGALIAFPSASAGLAAALALEHAVVRFGRRHELALSVRGGISIGDVAFDEDDIHGLPVVEATRLAALAAEGQILCAEPVRHQARGRGGHDFGPAQVVTLRGLEGTVTVQPLLWSAPSFASELPFADWSGPDELPLVGRRAELDALRAQLKAAAAGATVVTLIEGEPGVGKTRLALEFARAAHDDGVAVLLGRCTEAGSRPYQPLAEAFDRVARLAPDWLLRAGRDGLAPELAYLTPAFTHPPYGLRPAAHLDEGSGALRLGDALELLLSRLTATEALILLLDDLHFATPETLGVLQRLLLDRGAPAAAALHAVVTCRTSPLDVPPGTRSLVDRLRVARHGKVLTLEGLSAEELGQTLRPDAGADAERLARQLVELTAGNAFYVTELLRAGRVGHDDVDATPPQPVAAFVRQRARALSPAAQSLLGTLSIDEGGLTLRHLERLEPGMESGTQLELVEELLGSGLVAERVEGQVRLAFTHEIARSAVYEGLSRLRRLDLHRRLADAMAAGVGEASAELFPLAAHRLACARSGDPHDRARAFEASRAAAERARAQFAHEEAARWYAAAAEMVDADADPGCDERVRLGVARVQCLDLARSPRAEAAWAETIALARRSGRPELLGGAALARSRGFFSQTGHSSQARIDLLREVVERLSGSDDVGLRARVLAELASELTWHPEGEQRFELAEEALRLARSSGERHALVAVLVRRHLTIAAVDTGAQRLAACEELLALAEQGDDRQLLLDAVFHRTGPALDVGDVALVRRLLARAERLAAETRHETMRWLVGFSQASCLLFEGDLAGAEAGAVEAASRGDRAANPEARAFLAEQLAEIRRLQGRLGELAPGLARAAGAARVDPVHATTRYLHDAGDPSPASRLLDEFEAGRLAVPRNLAERPALDNLAYLAARLGRPAAAEQLHDRLAAVADTFGHSAVAHPCGHHQLAVLAAALGRRAEAEEHFARAAELHRARGGVLLQAETLIEWIDVLRRWGPVPADHELVVEARAALAGRGALGLERRLVAPAPGRPAADGRP